MIKGRLHSIETLGSLDGPGLRTVFFLQGCNMQCIYCHNRDSWSTGGGTEYSVKELAATATSYREYYGDDGGVTFSGGEPLLQTDFIIEAVAELKKHNINTVIDTSGSVCNSRTMELFQAADLIILDIKHSKADEYGRICGYPGDNAFSNLRYLQNSSIRYWIRQVIVDGITDDSEQIKHLRKILQFGNKPEKTELLPYHDMGKEKWEACGSTYPLKEISTPSTIKMIELEKILNGEPS